MAIKKTRQRQRGGPYSKFDKTKTLPREFQIVESGDPNTKDGRAVYIAFEAGEPKRLSTYEDMQEEIDNATEEIQGTLTSGVDKKIKEADAAITSAKSAATKANTATTNANTATDSANKAADNANKAVENIQSKVAINDKQPSATTAYSGNKIETEFLKKNGDSSETTVTFEVATQRANIQPQDTLEIAFGKLAKFCGDLKSHAFAAPVNNLAGTNPDLALAAPMGKELKGEIDALNSALMNKIVLGSDKNTTLIVTDQTLKFVGGAATVNLNTISSAYQKTAGDVIAQLKSASAAVITSANVSKNIATIKCSNLSGTPYEGEIAITLLIFMS